MAVLEATAPILLHKNLSVSGIKVLDNEQGIVEAFVAGIGNKDSAGDIIQPGAFDDSLKIRTPKGVWSHDWSKWISKTLAIYQVLPGDPRLPMKMALKGVGGLYVKTQFNLDTQDGRDAFSNVKFFDDESEWSIGYMEVETEYSKDLQANLLNKIDLYEYSPVLFGANTLTSTVSVKIDRFGGKYRIQVSGLEDENLEALVSKAVAESLAGTKEEAVSTTAPEEKAVPGSLEAQYGALVSALSSEYPDGYVFPIATFTDSVVFEYLTFSNDPDDDGAGPGGIFQRSYTLDENGAVIFGEPKAVDVVEVVVEKMGGIEALEAKGGSLEALKKAVAEGLQEKAGRVLSVKNQDRLQQAKTLIDEVIGSGEKVSEDDGDNADEKEVPIHMASNDPLEIVISGEKGAVATAIENILNKGAIASHSTKTDDGSWDGPAAKKNVTSPNDQGKSYFGKIYAWVDSGEDATVKASYKFIHHEVSSDGAPGAANVKACQTGIGVLNGGMAGTTIPKGDVQGVYNHLAKHLKDAGETPPDLKIAGATATKSNSPDDAGAAGVEPFAGHGFEPGEHDKDLCSICANPIDSEVHMLSIQRVSDTEQANNSAFGNGDAGGGSGNDASYGQHGYEYDAESGAQYCSVCGLSESDNVHNVQALNASEGHADGNRSNADDGDPDDSGAKSVQDVAQLFQKGRQAVQQVQTKDDDGDDTAAGLAQAVDAAIDAATDALGKGDVASATDLLTAAEIAIDELIEMLGGVDADESDGEKAENCALDVKELLASFDTELSLVDSFLGTE